MQGSRYKVQGTRFKVQGAWGKLIPVPKKKVPEISGTFFLFDLFEVHVGDLLVVGRFLAAGLVTSHGV